MEGIAIIFAGAALLGVLLGEVELRIERDQPQARGQVPRRVRSMSRAAVWDWFRLFGILGMVMAITGAVAGFYYGSVIAHDVYAWRDRLRAQCISGNDRACTIYRVDYE